MLYCWANLWCGEMTLMTTFLALFCIAQNKEALVADYMRWHFGVLVWDVLFTRAIHDWVGDGIFTNFSWSSLFYSAIQLSRDGED